MQKYSFLVYHREYGSFLQDLQQLGVLHVIEKQVEINENIRVKYELLNRFDKVIGFLKKRQTERKESSLDTGWLEIIEDITQKQSRLEELKQELVSDNKERIKVEPWGNFSTEIIKKLHGEKIFTSFFIASKKKFNAKLLSDYYWEVINDSGSNIHFVIIHKSDEEIDINAEEIKLPGSSYAQIVEKIKRIRERIELINGDLDKYVSTAIPLLKKARAGIAEKYEYEKVVLNTSTEVDEKLMLLEGWVPGTKRKKTKDFLNKNNVLFITEKPTPKDSVPVLLKNNKFSKLFEPIGKLFSLPAYTEIDLTAFFAPFFMMFFGFCLGDAGYGLLFIIVASIYKFKAKEEIKPLLTLAQFLGFATVVFGILTGTFFGINLIIAQSDFLADFKSLFLDPEVMFNLALILGGIQIIFGMFVKAVNQIRQYGFVFSLATFGWLIVLLGGGAFAALSKLGFIAGNSTILYAILALGGFFILFFSDPETNILSRIGKGVWDVYTTVTGIFGDLLSYIRLFALGLASAILGFVINDIAMQILDSGSVVEHLFFVIFLLFGHTLNIFISTLGSFVHSMRLTFVEFYKNAGYAGGGKEYKPFSK